MSNITKNTSYLAIALILQKIISFSYFTILVRNLEPESLGKYFFAISFTTIFAIFIDIGMANVLTRETAKNQNNAQNLLSAVLSIKFPLAILSLIITITFVNLFGYSALIKHLIYLSCISMVLDSFTTSFFAIIRGFHNLKFESIGAIIFQFIVMVFGIIMLYFKMDLRWLMMALVLASSFYFLYAFIILWKKWHIKIMPLYDKVLIKSMIKIALPFGIFAIFQRFYTYFDSVLLLIFAGERAVGLYQPAFKIIFALQFIPMAFTASLYPAMSNYWINDKQRLTKIFEQALNYIIIISIPISIGIISLSDKIVLLFKSDYNEATLPIQIIIVALFFIFINFPIGSLLNACDKQKINTINMGIIVCVSIILNLILIPKFQTVGASITVFITNALMFVLGIYWTSKIIRYNYQKIFITFLKAALSAVVMCVFILYFKLYINIFIIILFSGLVYFIALFLLGGIKKEDVIRILEIIRIKKS